MARNGQFWRLAKSAGFRRNPQQHAGTGAIRQEKTPTENGWGFVIGGPGSFEQIPAGLANQAFAGSMILGDTPRDTESPLLPCF